MLRIALTITGRVQGVFYRANARVQATELGLAGWVRNVSDGSVEIIAEGEKLMLEKFIKWCKIGSPSSRVDNIEVKWQTATGEFKNFAIRY